MDFIDRRPQLIANCRFLYGSNTEVLTLSHNAGCQAVAMSFDALTASWTKFLHSSDAGSTIDAIRYLLQETEIEIAKRFSINRIGVPCSGEHFQKISLHARVQGQSGASSSTRSDDSGSEFLATPGSSVSENEVVVTALGEYSEDARPAAEEDIPEDTPCEPCVEVEETIPEDFPCEPCEEAPPASEENIPEDTLCKPYEEVLSAPNENIPEDFPCEPCEEAPPASEENIPEDTLCKPYEEVLSAPNENIPEDFPCEPCEEAPPASEENIPEDTLCKPYEEVLSAPNENIPADPLCEPCVVATPIPDEYIPVDPPCEPYESALPALEEYVKSKPPAPGSEEAVLEAPLDDFPEFTKPKKGKKNGKGKKYVEPEPLAPESEEAVVDASVDDFPEFPKGKKGKKGKKGGEGKKDVEPDSISQEPETEEKKVKGGKEEKGWVVEKALALEPEPEAVIDDFGWGSFATKKDKKKKRKNADVEPIFEAPPPLEPEKGPKPELEPEVDGAGWGAIVEAPPPPKPEPVVDDFDYFGWGSSVKKDKKKKGKVVEASAPEAEKNPEPEPEPQADETSWGSFAAKKDKKKKGKAVIEEAKVEYPPPSPPPLLLADFEPELAKVEDDLGWGSFATKKDKKKKGKNAATIEEPKVEEPIPELENEKKADPLDDFGWGTTSKKDKKKKGKNFVILDEPKVEEPPPALELEPEAGPITDDFDWGATTQKDKKKKGKAVIEESKVEDPSAPEPAPAEASFVKEVEAEPIPGEPFVETIEVPLPQEIEEPSMAITSLLVLPEDTIGRIQPRPGPTIVLKILYTSKTAKQILGTMVTLKDNTLKAIFSAVNSYLDSRTLPAQSPSQRTLEIKYGAGKNGDLELSALDENMWPEYLEYFRQCTKFPELTVNVVDG